MLLPERIGVDPALPTKLGHSNHLLACSTLNECTIGNHDFLYERRTNRSMSSTTVVASFLLFLATGAPAIASPASLLASGRQAHCRVSDGAGTLEAPALSFSVSSAGGSLRPEMFVSRLTGQAHSLTGELFVLALRDGRRVKTSGMQLDGAMTCGELSPVAGASQEASRLSGVALRAKLRDAGTGIEVEWRLLLRSGTNYVRQELTFSATRDTDVAAISLIDLSRPRATVVGTVAGSPIVADDIFLGFEHPMAVAKAFSGHASMTLKRALPLKAGVPVTYSAVFGVAAKTQMRRAFQSYIESERAHPFRTFLHYNSWYDIGYFTPYTADDALRVISAYGDKLVKARAVRMDSFLFDDGWDDTSRLWQFNSGFPQGFAPLQEAAARIGAAPGIWLSPWGGYGAPRRARLATAKAAGHELDDEGLALSGPRYYALFRDTTLRLLGDYGINQFKLDGTGNPDKVTPGSSFDSDFSAAIALVADLRKVKPDLFINLTTGTWPSPFWLRTADSIWRGGDDHDFAGVGSNRQRWITYRDADTYGGIVRLGPLYPLNSLMLHGIIYARHADGLNTDPNDDLADEVWSYFASGTGLQEMYISPDLLSEKNWDDLAAAAKWARSRAEVLRDSHWIGGDPARAMIYGWASWSAKLSVIALRNPSDRPQKLQLDLRAALELQPDSADTWQVSSPRKPGESKMWVAAAPIEISLQPFEVRIWELRSAAAALP